MDCYSAITMDEGCFVHAETPIFSGIFYSSKWVKVPALGGELENCIEGHLDLYQLVPEWGLD